MERVKQQDIISTCYLFIPEGGYLRAVNLRTPGFKLDAVLLWRMRRAKIFILIYFGFRDEIKIPSEQLHLIAGKN